MRVEIDECIENGILKDFFVRHRKEVVEMEMWDYNEELHYKTIAQEKYEDGYEGGVENTMDMLNWLLEQGREVDMKKAISDKEFKKKCLRNTMSTKKHP